MAHIKSKETSPTTYCSYTIVEKSDLQVYPTFGLIRILDNSISLPKVGINL